MMYVQTDETGRIFATTEFEEYASEDMIQFEFPEGFDFSKQDEYRIQNGELVHDPLPEDPSAQIAELKAKLKETDYISTKLMDYQVMSRYLSDDEAERYSEIMAQRQEWRDKINELQAQIDGQEGSA